VTTVQVPTANMLNTEGVWAYCQIIQQRPMSMRALRMWIAFLGLLAKGLRQRRHRILDVVAGIRENGKGVFYGPIEYLDLFTCSEVWLFLWCHVDCLSAYQSFDH
jgi:hypothetical protein